MTIEDWKSEYILAMVSALIENPDWTETHANYIASLCADEVISSDNFNSETMIPSEEAIKTISGW